MSFNVVLQTNTSDAEHLTKELTTVTTLSGVLRDGCDIRNPVILIESTLAALSTANYFTIQEFGRSYFLTGVHSVRNGLVEIAGKCDVLSTFATAIRAQTAVIRRAESASAYNLLLNDGSLQCYQDPYILTEPFPSGFTGNSFILAVAGAGGST